MRLRSLQYLRGIAAILVVYFHSALQVNGIEISSPWLPIVGSSGVDIFFVLSGFVMWTAHRPGTDGGRAEYFRRRLVRIVPLYWLVTAFSIAVALALPQLTRSVRVDWPHALASFLFVPYANPAFALGSANAVTPIVVPGWTLNYEMFFYLLFGLVLPLRAALRLGLLAAAFAFLYASHRALPDGGSALTFYASSYLCEFLYGATMAYCFERIRPRSRASASALAAFGLALLIAVDAAGLSAWPGVLRGIPAMMMVLGALSLERAAPIPEVRWLHLLGDASYSIYLTHGFAIAALRTAWRVFDLSVGPIGQLVFVASGLACGSALGVVVYRTIEQPLLRLMRGGRLTRDSIPQPYEPALSRSDV